MIEVAIPSRRTLRLEHLVLDYNGTIAVDGAILPGVVDRLMTLSRRLRVHVLTADTFGVARRRLHRLPCEVTVLSPGAQDQAKVEAVRALGAERCVCIGNGHNDRMMIEAAGLGIAVILGEGACSEAVAAADVVCTGIADALDLLTHPLRLVATMRC